MESLVLGAVCIAIVIASAYVITRRYDKPASQMATLDCGEASLIVMVKDHGGSASIEVYGKNAQDLAYAAAYLTQMAAKQCPDGFERGLEYIQDDAMNFARD